MQYVQKKANGLCIAGFVVAMVSLFINFWGIVGLTGLILSIAGVATFDANKQTCKGLGIAGIVIGAISVVWGLFTLLVLFSLFA